MSNNIRIIAAGALWCAAVAGLAGCTGGAATPEPDSSTAAGPAATVAVNETARALLPDGYQDGGALVVASDPTYPPFEFMDSDNETLIGFDIDLAGLLAQSLGLDTTHKAATFDTILPGLSSGKYDVGISAFSITPERQLAVDFVPYSASGTALGVAPGNPKQLSLLDMSVCGHAVAAQNGSTQALEQLPALSEKCVESGAAAIDVQTFPSQTDTNLALVSGRIDAVASDSVALAEQARVIGDKFEVVGEPDFERVAIGMALQKDSPLSEALNAAMRDLIETPEYAALFAKWEIPESVGLTAADFDAFGE